MHPVQHAPGHRNEGIDERDSGVEWELCDLCAGELTEGVAEGDNAFVVGIGKGEGADAVVAGAFDRVVDCGRVVELDGFGDDLRGGDFGCIGGENEGAKLLAPAGVDAGLVADVLPLYGRRLANGSAGVWPCIWTDRFEAKFVLLLRHMADEISIAPLEHHQAHCGITLDVVRLDELCEDVRVCIATPCFSRIHSRADLSVVFFLVLSYRHQH